jgi:hypothetical protein
MTATLTIEFWDTRYTIDTVHPVTISLTIGGLPWENCIHNKPITDAASCAAYGCSLTRETGHFKITAECVVPDVRGTQTVRVEPKFESAPVSLNPAAASITISETESTVQAAQLAGKIMNLLDAFLSNPSRFLDLLFIGAVHL